MTKETQPCQKMLMMTSYWKIVMPFLFFWFTANLEQSKSWILEAWSVRHTFINCNLLSYKNWNQNYKISNTAFILLLWVKVLFFKQMLILQKKNQKTKADISKLVLVLKGIFSETRYVCVLKYQIRVNCSRKMNMKQW